MMESKWSRPSSVGSSAPNADAQAKLADLRTLMARAERRVFGHWQGNPSLFPGREKALEKDSARWSIGVPEVDDALPESGLMTAAVHEVSGATYGDVAAASGYVLALLNRLARNTKSTSKISVLWCQASKTRSEFGVIHGRGLQTFGLDPHRFLFVEADHNRDVLWAIEEGARTAGLQAVVGELGTASFTETRRLTLAAAEGGTPVLLLRPHDDRAASAAETRWRIGASPGAPDPFVPNVPGHLRWHVKLCRCRGGRPGNWFVEWNNEAHRFRLVQEFPSRSSEAAGAPKRHGGADVPEQWRASA